MAELAIEKTCEEWWPARLELLELEYENSKLRVFQDGLMCEKWKTEIDLLINDEKLHKESLNCEKLSQTNRKQERLLQDQIKSLEKEVKESKELLCETKESLEDVKEKNKAEKERLQERLLQAEEKHVKEQEKFEKERDTLNKEIDKWKNMKEKLEVDMKEMEETLGLEADEKLKQQEEEANTEIERLNKEFQMWKDKYDKALQEVEALQEELANKNVVSKTKATQTQNKMANKAAMARVECATIGIQAEIPTECDSKEEAGQTKNKTANKAVMVGVEYATIGIQVEIPNSDSREAAEQTTQNKMARMEKCISVRLQAGLPAEWDSKQGKMLSKKQAHGERKSVRHSHKDSESVEQTRSGEQPDKCLEKDTSDSQEGTNDGPTKAKQKRIRNPRKSVQSKQTKTSDKKDEVGTDEEHNDVHTGPPGNVPTGAGDDVFFETPDDVPTEMDEEIPTCAEKNVLTGTKSNSRTGAQENLPTGESEKQVTGHQASDKESTDKTVKRVRKRKCNKEPCETDEMNVKKTKKSSKTKGSSEDRNGDENQDSRDATEKAKENRARVVQDDDDQQKRPSVNDKNDTSCNKADKQRKTSEQTNKENVLKDKKESSKGTRPGAGISKPRYPSTQPSLSDRTRQSSIAEMSSILNGTKRQRTLLNPKDTSLMVSFLPVQESFMNSTMSRGHKPNGTMPPSLSSFMRSFIAPKLKKNST